MQQQRIGLANIAGTTLMTLFSNIVSAVAQKNFSEPDLLSQFLEHAPASVNKKHAKIAGWVGHYAMGHVFAAAYVIALKQLGTKPSVKNGLAMGLLSGVAGIGVWKAAFKVHPHPPKTPSTPFFVQLLIAHVVFGLVTDAALQWLDNNKPHDEITESVKAPSDDGSYYPMQDENAVVSPS